MATKGWRVGAAAAALLVTGGLGGWTAGRSMTVDAEAAAVVESAPAAESRQPQFLLLIRETAATLELESRVGTEALVAEYSAWAGSLAQAGQLVAAEKLGNDGTAVSTAAGMPVTGQAEGAVSGFFLIRAADAAAARAVAEASPHVRYGGVVEVRPIDAT